ncbi:MAG: DUF6585 family protein [Chloroflexota bacterium]
MEASPTALGRLLSKHPVSGAQTWGGLLAGVVLIVLGPAIYFGLTIFWGTLGSEAQAVFDATPFLRYLPLALGIIFLIMGILRLFQAWRNWPLAANLYEGGIEYTDRKGTRQISLDQVEGFYLHVVRYTYYYIIPAGTTYLATVTQKGGEVIVLDNRLSKIKQLCEGFQERLASVQMPAYLAKIQAGQRIEFGVLSLDQSGIYQGNKSLPWAEVGKVTLEDGTLSISRQGKWGNWAKYPFSQIPNAALFYTLAKQMAPTG